MSMFYYVVFSNGESSKWILWEYRERKSWAYKMNSEIRLKYWNVFRTQLGWKFMHIVSKLHFVSALVTRWRI